MCTMETISQQLNCPNWEIIPRSTYPLYLYFLLFSLSYFNFPIKETPGIKKSMIALILYIFELENQTTEIMHLNVALEIIKSSTYSWDRRKAGSRMLLYVAQGQAASDRQSLQGKAVSLCLFRRYFT